MRICGYYRMKKAWFDTLQARKDGFFDKFGIIQPDVIWNAIVSGRLPEPTEKELNELQQFMKEMRYNLWQFVMMVQL